MIYEFELNDLVRWPFLLSKFKCKNVNDNNNNNIYITCIFYRDLLFTSTFTSDSVFM